MKTINKYIAGLIVVLLAASCGRSGDPGHCFISIDWEYYNENYGVYYYEDDNPDVPESQFIDPGWYYDSYPGYYEYYYEAEDPDEWFTYTGYYELFQNPGTEGGLFRDGWDGVDTYFDLYLYVYAKKGLALKDSTNLKYLSTNGVAVSESGSADIAELNTNTSASPALASASRSGRAIKEAPVRTMTHSWEQNDGAWTIRVTEEVRVYRK